MVGRLDVRRAADESSDSATRIDTDVVVREDAGRLAMTLVAHKLRQVLMKLASTQYVEDLHAAADGKHGQLAIERRAKQLELGLVAARVDDGRLRVWLGAVESRIQIGASGEDEAVDCVERLLDGLRLRRDHQC